MLDPKEFRNIIHQDFTEVIVISIKIENSSPCVFAIDGVAGSGKTTLASKLQSDIPGSQVVHMDDLYSGWRDPLSQELTERVCNEILNPFLQGNEVIYRKFDWHQNVFGETMKIAPTKTLFLEGVGAGQSAFRKMLSKTLRSARSADLYQKTHNVEPSPPT